MAMCHLWKDSSTLPVKYMRQAMCWQHCMSLMSSRPTHGSTDLSEHRVGSPYQEQRLSCILPLLHPYCNSLSQKSGQISPRDCCQMIRLSVRPAVPASARWDLARWELERRVVTSADAKGTPMAFTARQAFTHLLCYAVQVIVFYKDDVWQPTAGQKPVHHADHNVKVMPS